MRKILFALLFVCGAAAQAQRLYPILFVTQTPIPGDFTAIGSVFGNHRADLESTGRGGDLYVLYPNGSLKNLTQLGGYGVATGFQGASSIAVREPAVHWNGTKAIFSMVIGAPTQQYNWGTYYWQLYEVTGLGAADPVVITKVPNQPANANNVSPVYAPDGRILFTSDRPRDGRAHLYPQLDEYEEAPTVSGLWSLNPTTGNLKLLDHAPSGDFKPTVDSFGRVVFTRWDHLQRDQQADSDNQTPGPGGYGTFNWSSERTDATALSTRVEQFPEPRAGTPGLLPNEEGHSFNHFFPWMINPDGTGLETLNHIGRHELHGYFNRSFNDDNNLDEFICGDDNNCGRFNPKVIENMLEIRESAMIPGRYFAVDAPEFYTHAAGMLFSLNGAPTDPADQMAVTWITHPDTGNFTSTPGPCHSGFYRNPLPLSAASGPGALIAVHAGERSAGVPETRQAANDGTQSGSDKFPIARYKFRLRDLTAASGGCAGYQKYNATLTPGITKSLTYWDPDYLVHYTNVTLWELDPVEVRSRPIPNAPTEALEGPEQAVFSDEQVDLAAFRNYLTSQNLALIVSRDVTTRDRADRQQPFNLRVPGGTQTIGASGAIYDVSHMQIFQADLIRGKGGTASPQPGRRVLAQKMHDPAALNPPLSAGSPAASVKLGLDGSMAALVPAQRAVTWHLTDATTKSVVKERYWLTFQPGEIRLCTSCHGLNHFDQTTAGATAPQNEPEALRTLLQWWKSMLFVSHFEGGNTSEWSSAAL